MNQEALLFINLYSGGAKQSSCADLQSVLNRSGNFIATTALQTPCHIKPDYDERKLQINFSANS